MGELKLEMRGISKRFPGVQALDGVDFALRKGEVHALLGVNGAGKSTLIKVLSGAYPRDAGTLLLDGQPVEINGQQDALARGIATVYQEPQMIPSFTGYENIFLGAENDGKGTFARIRRSKLREKAARLLELFPVDVDLSVPVGKLGTVDQEIVAVFRALSRKISVLVLDEPTSILTEREKLVLFRLVASLKEQGISIIYISHRLEEIQQVADRLTVLRNGRNVATLEVRGAAMSPLKIAELMLGERMETVYPPRASERGDPVLSARGLGLDGKFHDVGFEARLGEILGVFGLVGSGAEELAKVLFGLQPPTRGSIELDGRTVRLRSARDAIARGMFLVPADRRREGLVPAEPIRFNVSLANLNRVSGFLGLTRSGRERLDVSEVVASVGVTPPDIRADVATLSGGNQQKVVVAKGIFTRARVYLFAEPTAGVDVGAKAGIYRLMRELAREATVILVSSDSQEVYGVSDRVMVLFKGQAVLDRPTESTSQEEILLCGVQGRV